MIFRPFYTVFAGENSWSEFFIALRALFFFGGSKKQVSIFETQFAGFVDRKYSTAFGSGRMALFAILKSLKITSGDEVILQAFTCNVVPRAIKAVGATPVYVDINPQTLNMNTNLLSEAINEQTRAVIIQHTFGVPPDTEGLRQVLAQKNVAIIEDCAHSFKPSEIEAIGDSRGFAFFSTDHTKPFNTHVGGVACCNSTEHAERISNIASSAVEYALWEEKRLQLSFLFEYLTHRPYLYFIMRFPMALLARLSVPFSWVDHHKVGVDGRHAGVFGMTRFQAMLGISQLKKVSGNISHRKNAFSILEKKFQWYGIEEPLPLLRYAMCVADRKKFIKCMPSALSSSIWFNEPVSGGASLYSEVEYLPGSCPIAEQVCVSIVNISLNQKVPIEVYENIAKNIEVKLKEFESSVPVVDELWSP